MCIILKIKLSDQYFALYRRSPYSEIDPIQRVTVTDKHALFWFDSLR